MNDWKKDKAARAQFAQECLRYPKPMTRQPIDNIPHQGPATPIAAWRSRHFAAILWVQIDKDEDGKECYSRRLSVNRCKIDNRGRWVDGITWDELQEIKTECGLTDEWAVEVFPPVGSVVNVANMRHLFLLDRKPTFAWDPA